MDGSDLGVSAIGGPPSEVGPADQTRKTSRSEERLAENGSGHSLLKMAPVLNTERPFKKNLALNAQDH